MKKLTLVFILIIVLLASGCNKETEKGGDSDTKVVVPISSEKMRRVELYATVLIAAFNVENGGNEFIAVKMDTLENISPAGKQEVLKKLSVISENVYAFEDVKDDSTKFVKDEQLGLSHSINGTLLSLSVRSYSKTKAKIEATSWFGNLGAVFPEYKATYKNNQWELELLSMAIS